MINADTLLIRLVFAASNPNCGTPESVDLFRAELSDYRNMGPVRIQQCIDVLRGDNKEVSLTPAMKGALGWILQGRYGIEKIEVWNLPEVLRQRLEPILPDLEIRLKNIAAWAEGREIQAPDNAKVRLSVALVEDVIAQHLPRESDAYRSIVEQLRRLESPSVGQVR